MIIEVDKNNKFLIKCRPEENQIVMGMPDRRYRKTSRTWAAPALRRNIEYMDRHMNNTGMYTVEALALFNEKRKELKAPIQGENVWPAWYEFKNAPLPHQDKGLKKFFPLDAAAIFYEQGLGKTFTSINLACAWRMTNQIDAVVVVCPSSIKLVWGDELEKHAPIPTQRCSLTSGKYEQAQRFIDQKMDFQWLIVGVEGLSQGSAIEYMEQFLRTRRCMMIIDESSRIKTPNKIRTDKTVKAGKLAVKRVILSGTSITQGLEDLYTQYKFLDPQIVGYDSYYIYRAQYCQTMNMVIGYDPKGNERTIQKIIGYKNEDELMELIKPYTERVEKKDIPALGIPPKVFMNRYVTMTPEQKRIYQEMKEDLFIEMGGTEYETKTVLEQMLRLQQITGGHYPHDDGEKVIAKPIPGKNPKVEELMLLLEEISGKVIIWCQFRSEILLISEALEKKKINYVEFHGGIDEQSKISAVESFRKMPKIKVFLATRAAAYGLTLIEASDAVYFSQSYSLEEYAQSQDRIHRIGQLNQCNYIHLVCDKTIDMKVVKALSDKASVADLIYSIMKD